MTTDRQVGGDHYTRLTIQPWQIIDACGLNFYEGNIIKYILRRKGTRVDDLKKAAHYLEHLIELENGKKGIPEQCLRCDEFDLVGGKCG